MLKNGFIALKAQLLCEGANCDASAEKLFFQQNPSQTKRGGLSSGGKIELPMGIFVNFPFYQKRECELKIVINPKDEKGVLIQKWGQTICSAKVLPAPDWYQEMIEIPEEKPAGDLCRNTWDDPVKIPITRVFTAHNKQLATSVYEGCELFGRKSECKFCVIKWSLDQENASLVHKKASLILAALEKIPVNEYGGVTLNGGMTSHAGRGMELIVPIVQEIRRKYPQIPIAVEITPPSDLSWIDKLAKAGTSSLMMNLEIWDPEIRKEIIPGKDDLCPRDSYFKAFERALNVLEKGKVSTCFVVGCEPIISLQKGIEAVIKYGVIPSPLSGRYFEDIPNYPFKPDVPWEEFLTVLNFSKYQLREAGITSTDEAGCIACGMCDLIKDVEIKKDPKITWKNCPWR